MNNIEIIKKYNSVLFLDVDGVLNCELFFEERYNNLHKYDNIPFFRVVKRHLKKLYKKKEMSNLDFYKSQMCPKRMSLLNGLCEDTNSVVVISASMRGGKTVERLQEIFKYCGPTFEIIDKTGHSDSRIRGVEIYEWLRENVEKWFGVQYHEFYRFAIIDDDSDMLLCQQHNFFHTDNYSGLTHNTCYKIKRFLTHKTF